MKNTGDWLGQLHVGKEAETVSNMYTGLNATLAPLEVAVYDFIKGCEATQQWDLFDEARDWFRGQNPKAYMTLLD